ncbi:unnamed protein product [Diamesa serratosioi]
MVDAYKISLMYNLRFNSIICVDDNYRLPTAVTPENYKLEITTHLGDEEGFIFKGNVLITLLVSAFTDNITLHVKDLTILTNQIKLYELMNDTNTSDKELAIQNIEFLPEHDFMVIFLNNSIHEKIKYQIYIPFEAPLESALLGYYKSSYIDKATSKRVWLAVTQFEPISARQAFPCFDEPAMKATFDICLIHHKNYTASLSNMPLKTTERVTEIEDFVKNTFETSVKMSTYLVAYSVSDFEYKEAAVDMKQDVIFRIYARHDAMDQVNYAADIGPKILKYYEDYFQIKFPLSKIDMIAIPDFGAGAMENWGLITYREEDLHFQPKISSLSSQHRVATVIAHELAHQWFGNLVTMDWWTDLWLNEGFATYIASLGVEFLHPEWKSLDEKSVDNTLNIFKFDALNSSHAVSVTIGHPNQITQMFDTISYEKGSVILHMMHTFLGEESFRDGVSNYLKKHSFKNTIQDDLWATLTDEAHKRESIPENLTVKDIMDTWTLQVGYPVISVERDYDTNSANLSQVRYQVRHQNWSNSDVCWWIPLTYTDSETHDFNVSHARDWMSCADDKQSEIKRIENLPGKDQWVIFNIQLAGLYKINYDRHNWRLIVNALNGPDYKDINTINRAQLIDDAMDLAWTGKQDYGIALALISYMKQEDEYIPWKSALENLKSIENLLLRTPVFGAFKSYIQHIVEPIYKRVGGIGEVEDSNRMDIVELKTLICSWACRYDVGDCVEKSVKLFKTWMLETDPDHINPVPLDLRSVVYCTAISNGMDDEWEFLSERYFASNVGSEKNMIIKSLSCTRLPLLLSRFLDWSLNSTLVRKQDAVFVFSGIVGTENGFDIAKKFFLGKIDVIHDHLYPDTSRMSRFIKPLAEHMSTLPEFHQMEDLFSSKKALFKDISQGVKQAIETIEINNQWRTNNYQDLSRYLTQFNFDDAKAFIN